MRVPTSGPDVQLFKRFQNQWQFIDQDNFDHGLLDMGFNATTVADIVHFCKDQLEQFQPRDDYREFQEFTIIILGGIPKRGIRFIARALCSEQDGWQRPSIVSRYGYFAASSR